MIWKDGAREPIRAHALAQPRLGELSRSCACRATDGKSETVTTAVGQVVAGAGGMLDVIQRVGLVGRSSSLSVRDPRLGTVLARPLTRNLLYRHDSTAGCSQKAFLVDNLLPTHKRKRDPWKPPPS
jgi:hypothetical protein